MKNSQFLTMLIAFVVGAGLMFGIAQMNKDDDADQQAELAKLRAELEALKTKGGLAAAEPKLTSLPQKAPAEVEEIATTDIAEDEAETESEEPVDLATAISNFANSKQGRDLMKMGIAQMRQGSEMWIQRGIAEYTEKLDLSDDQVARLKERFTEYMNKEMEAFEAEIGNENMNFQEIMQKRGEMRGAQEEAMLEIVKEELTEEQFADFEREQLVEKTQRVQQDSDRELRRLDNDLNLTESQEDAVFGILVQTNSEYDDSMEIEGAGEGVAIGADVAKEDAIRSVLDAEQTEKYNANLERNAQRRARWSGGGFGRGFGR